MYNWALVAQRELKERIKSRSFILMAILGPLIVLLFTYLLFAFGGSSKKHWNVLIMDQNELMENKLMPRKDPMFSFDFINAFVDYDQFASLDKFQEYDLTVWVNEKVLTNKTVIVSFRERPSDPVQRRLIYHIERRLEEVMVDQFTDLSVKDFRAIKQPLNFSFKNTYDPKDEVSYQAQWVGYFFGGVIILFVFLFGMTILRAVAKEKTNRITEVLVSVVSPKHLLVGKILGIGITAILQFLLWVVIIGVGLYVYRFTLFPDIFDPGFVAEQVSNSAAGEQQLFGTKYANESYNAFVDLVYNQIHFGNMLLFFVVFFVGAFMFYGAFFAAIGSAMGSESDGQQYIIPLNILLILALLSGYYTIYYPDGVWASVAAFLPFTSPVTMMVNIGSGFSEGAVWELYLSIFTLFVAAFLMLYIASRVYKNGILQFGHRLRVDLLFKWIKKS